MKFHAITPAFMSEAVLFSSCFIVVHVLTCLCNLTLTMVSLEKRSCYVARTYHSPTAPCLLIYFLLKPNGKKFKIILLLDHVESL